MKKRVVQFSAGFLAGDAISNEMLAIDTAFRRRGYVSELYSEFIKDDTRNNRVKKYYNYSSGHNDVIIYHHSIHSGVYEFLEKMGGRKILIYHNVTPYHFFEPYSLSLAWLLKKGREDLYDMRNSFQLAFGDTEFNTAELRDTGFTHADVLPIVYDFDQLVQGEGTRSGKRVLFVGRIAPNKKQDDLLRLAAAYREIYGEELEFVIAGYCPEDLISYKEELEYMISFYGLKKVIFTGYITNEDLYRHYSSADVFVSMSEHEGFCVPLLESMYFGLPVLAFDAGAVRETLDSSGVLFKRKDFGQVAVMLDRILKNSDFRDTIIKGQNSRLAQYRKISPDNLIEEKILSKLQEYSDSHTPLSS